MVQRVESNECFPNVAGYCITELICAGDRTLVYRGVRIVDQQPVVLKLLKHEPPPISDLLRLRNHHTVTDGLNLPGVVCSLGLEPWGRNVVLVMADEAFCSLDRFLQNHTLSLTEFLHLAIQLSDILDSLARHHIIHKDIKPSNILIHPHTQQVKLTDFGLASQLPQENPELRSPGVLEGTLAYLSPEQTGRMNRGIDYRSDFYALGVTFYELLTGQLPFQSDDPLELVYCHLAQEPVPPHKRVPTLPVVLSQMVLKLMAKNAEDRYQSALGLKADLEQCLQQLETTGTIGDFELGQIDELSQFNIPQKLYGRETQVKTLQEAFERVSQGHCELVLVSGYSGIGKTALVNEILRQLTRHQGYFASGKFDQFQRDVPLKAVSEAYRKLIGQLLTESEARLHYWRERLLRNLGANAQLIIDAIPELELIIGPQAAVPELGAIESAHRLVRTFNQFADVFQSPEHPQVVFMDDVQWADLASMQALQGFITSRENRYSLAIVAYRDHEVSQTHLLTQTVEAIRRANIPVTEIHLAPLEQCHVAQMVAETLRTDLELVVPVANLLFAKTAGNPFFLIQLLKSWYEDGLIWFGSSNAAPLIAELGIAEPGIAELGIAELGIAELGSAQWQWNLEQIAHYHVANNVVDLMIDRITKLSESAQGMLQLAACIGGSFDLHTLAVVSNQPLAQAARKLWEAIQAGLIIPVGQGYRLPQVFNADELTNLVETNSVQEVIAYRFLHDRVQQAAYALIPQNQKQRTHLTIGQLLLNQLSEAERTEKIFEVVNHLNIGAELISQSERDTLAQLNLLAGLKAKTATAYSIAQEHFTRGCELLAADCWQTNYGLTLSLFELTAETAYLVGEFEQAETCIETVLQNTQTLLDTVKVYTIKAQIYLAQGQILEAIQMEIQLLERLGMRFPDDLTRTYIEQAMAENKALMPEGGIDDLINLPQMVDSYALAKLRILNSLAILVNLSAPQLFAPVILAQIKLSLLYGNSAFSVPAYAFYSIILVNMNEFDAAYQWGQFALKLLPQFADQSLRAKVLFLVALFSMQFKTHLSQSLQLFCAGYQIGLDLGDLEHTAWHCFNISLTSYLMGKELNEVEANCAVNSQAIRQLNQAAQLLGNETVHQVVLNLLGRSIDPCRLVGDVFDEEQVLQRFQADNIAPGIGFIYLFKLSLCYWFGNYQQALVYAEMLIEQYLLGIQGQPILTVFYFYKALAQLAVYHFLSSADQISALNQVSEDQSRLRHWAHHAPMNYLHKLELVEAEQHRVLGNKAEAIDLYDRAIAGARANGYLQEEALANELAAQFYLDWGKPKLAADYMQSAYDCYRRWGARAKLADLEERYPQLLTLVISNQSAPSDPEDTPTDTSAAVSIRSSSSTTTLLDLATVLKASQAISQEIQLERLLITLIQVAMENAGAQTGTFLLKSGDEWTVVAHCSSAQSCFLQSLPLADGSQLPLSVIHYVQRTQEAVVIDSVTDSNPFLADPYWLQQVCKSVLCVPIVRQSQLIGILYLENQIAAGAFTPDCQEVVQLIVAQVAIALENAQLYSTLEQKVAERTQELSQALTDLQATQQELIQSEKMAVLGQLTASIAHEINTPLGVIRGAASNIAAAFKATLQQLPSLMQRLSPQQQADLLGLVDAALQSQLSLSTREERQLRRQLQAELQALGLSAAERIASLFVLLGLGTHWSPYESLLFDPEGVRILETAYNLVLQSQNTWNIQHEVDRAAKIVFALKTYTYQHQSAEKICANVTDGIEVVLTLYQNRLKQGIEVIRRYREIPEILCNPDELIQVWVNLIDNAIAAMNQQGILEIDLWQQEQKIIVEITDSGSGIPPELQSRIFELFFTTKAQGEGSGLGLDIVKRIVQQHGGQIQLSSRPGRTTFRVQLPLNS